MQTPIVNETSVRRSIADPDDFAIQLPSATTGEPPRQPAASPVWDATQAPRRSMA